MLKVPVEVIKNFNDEAAVNIIANTFNEQSVWSYYLYQPVFNQMDKIIETMECLLKNEQEKNVLLEKLLAEK